MGCPRHQVASAANATSAALAMGLTFAVIALKEKAATAQADY